MEEVILIKIAFVCVLIGIPLLYIASLHVDQGEFSLEPTRISGRVTGVYPGNVTKFWVEEKRIVPVVVFDNVDVKRGSVVDLIGEERDGEFIAEEIRIHRS